MSATTIIFTLLLESDADKIVSALVKNGYAVEAGSVDNTLCHGFKTNLIGGTCCVRITNSTLSAQELKNSLVKTFGELKYFLSL